MVHAPPVGEHDFSPKQGCRISAAADTHPHQHARDLRIEFRAAFQAGLFKIL